MCAMVSIVIPTYNRRKVISRSIDSCLNQTYRDFEIIISDDHSTDGTIEYVKEKYADSDKIIFCSSATGEKGANAARNAGIRAANGEYIAFLDSDDQLTMTSISDRLAVFEMHPDVDMVYGDVTYDNRLHRFDKMQNYNARKYLLRELSLCIFPSIMVRKSVFIDMPLLDIEFRSWQDDDFAVQLMLHNKKMYHCGKVVARIHKDNPGITSNYSNLYEGCKRIVNKYAREIASETSFGRVLAWRLRVLCNWFRKGTQGRGITRKVCVIIYVVLNKICSLLFKHIWG